MPTPIVHRMDRGHVLLSDRWVASTPTPHRTPPPPPPPPPLLRPPRRSLEYNGLDDHAKQAVKDAAGSGVIITF